MNSNDAIIALQVIFDEMYENDMTVDSINNITSIALCEWLDEYDELEDEDDDEE